MVEFTGEQLKYLEDLLWLPCCHTTGTHDPSHYRERKYVCVYQKEKALHRLCETLGLNPQTKSKDDCYWCNEGTEAEEEKKGEGLRLFQNPASVVRDKDV